MRQQLCKLGAELERRGSSGIYCGHLVQKIREPHEVFVITQVEAEHSVVDHLVADVHLLRECLLGEIKHRGSQCEVFVETILRVKTHKRLALHTEHRLVFESHAHVSARIDNALIRDGDNAHAIIYGIVAIFSEHYSACHHHYRPSGHIHGIQSDRGSV